jgi:hypothetical protein
MPIYLFAVANKKPAPRPKGRDTENHNKFYHNVALWNNNIHFRAEVNSPKTKAPEL